MYVYVPHNVRVRHVCVLGLTRQVGLTRANERRQTQTVESFSFSAKLRLWRVFQTQTVESFSFSAKLRLWRVFHSARLLLKAIFKHLALLGGRKI